MQGVKFERGKLTQSASHHLELCIADALKSTLFADINEVLQKVYCLFKNSPKKRRQLEEIEKALDLAVSFCEFKWHPLARA